MTVSVCDIFYASKLKQLREMRGDIQFSVSSELKVSQQNYSELEQGKRIFSDHIIKTVERLYVQPGKIYSSTDPEFWFHREIFVLVFDICHKREFQGFFELVINQFILKKNHDDVSKELDRVLKLIYSNQSNPADNIIRIGYLKN
jgi:transcriptional regulator with XRE-family HTH domain